MKKTFILFLLSALISGLNAQDIMLNFQSIDYQNTIDQVILTNVTQNETVVIEDPSIPFNYSEAFVGISENQFESQSENMRIYPNPGNGFANVSFNTTQTQYGKLKVLGLDGKMLINEKLSIRAGQNNVKLEFADYGVYIIAIETANAIFSKKYLNISNNGSVNQIQSVSYDEQSNLNEHSFKGKNGDLIIMEAHSGVYKTIITDQVVGSKTYWFAFFECADMDNNNYAAVQIGAQWWMAENLRTTKYNDGSNIPLVESNSEWTLLNDNYEGKGMSWYENNSDFAGTYGGLYSYAAVTNNIGNRSNQGICPDGWHIPTETEFQKLVNYLSTNGNELEPATVLKSTNDWLSATDLTNKYGFTALPSGQRFDTDGSFSGITEMTSWWTNDEVDADNAKSARIEDLGTDVFMESVIKTTGKSVRCVMDQPDVVLDGFYVTGSATGEIQMVEDYRMTTAKNEVNQEYRPQLHELYISLKGNAGFNIVGVNGPIIDIYGPGSDFQLITEPGMDEPNPGTFWRGSAEESTEMFIVPEDGFYHVVYDEEVDVVVLAKVNWAMIGGATQSGWVADTFMEYAGYNHDSAVFTLDSIPLTVNDYKYRYSGGWKIEIDITDPNPDNHIKINTNLGGDPSQLIPGGNNLSIVQSGYYDVKLLWDKSTKSYTEYTQWLGELPANDYSNVELGLIGDGFEVEGNPWSWDQGWNLHLPVVSGDLYTWTWNDVPVLSSGSFKIREGIDWSGYVIGYPQVVMAGDAASFFEGNGDGNFAPITDIIVDVEFTIDGSSGIYTFNVNSQSTLIDGIYIVGPAAGATQYEGHYRMNTAINEVNQMERTELNELYLTLNGGSGFNIVVINNSTEITMGPGADYQAIMNPVMDEPDAGTFWRGSAMETTDMFQVPEDGLYHVVYDTGVNKVVLAKVDWAMIGQATEIGWSGDTEMAYEGFSMDSASFILDSVSLTPGDYKYRYSGGWKIEIDTTDVNMMNHIKINTNLGTDGDQVIPGEANFTISQSGYYDVSLLWDKITKVYIETTTKVADMVFSYTDLELALIGEAIEIEGVSLGWETDWEPHTPAVNGDIYTWTWNNVSLVSTGGFKIREAYAWTGTDFGYYNTVIEGDAAGNIIDDGSNFAVSTDQVVNIVFTIDATTETNTFTVNAVR